MFAIPTGIKVSLAFVILAAGTALSARFEAVLAAERSAEDIIKALKPTPRLLRSMTSPAEAARTAEEARFVDTLRNRPPRTLTPDEREKIASIGQKMPSIDLEVNFGFNSATIGLAAMSQVRALGQALTSHDLKGGTFLIAGHTDAKGSDTYNLGLSERRADAVKAFLSENYAIELSNLVAVGYGKTRLKNAAEPFSFENRRVQVINMAEK